MHKSLLIYPISAGEELNVFSSEHIFSVKIMDMSGNVLMGNDNIRGTRNIINIKQLPEATYIVEVKFSDERTGRSVFVKM